MSIDEIKKIFAEKEQATIAMFVLLQQDKENKLLIQAARKRLQLAKQEEAGINFND